MSEKNSAYEVLGVAPDASPSAITAAYQNALARIDAAGGMTPALAEERQLLGFAYETLSDPGRRARYDRRLREIETPMVPIDENFAPVSRQGLGPLGWVAGLAVVGALAGLWWWGGQLKRHAPPPKVAQMPGHPPLKGLALAASPPAVEVAPAPASAPEGPLSAAGVFQRNRDATVIVMRGATADQPAALGSGVVVAPDAVVTNCHVVAQNAPVSVRFQGQEYRALPRYRDTGHDLCQFDVRGLPATPVAVAPALPGVGERVYALGAPQGLELTLSEGIVSALRTIKDMQLIQVSAAISPGSSGGGLYDQYGRLVGITTFQATTGQNLNFAVPAEWIAALPRRDGNSDSLLASIQAANSP